MTTSPEQFAQAAKVAAAMRAEIGKALVGQKEVIDAVLCALLAGGHVLVEGVPGLGKTLLVRALARTNNQLTRLISAARLRGAHEEGSALEAARGSQIDVVPQSE